jgi:hypothetical protein
VTRLTYLGEIMEAHHETNRRKTVVKRAIVMAISVLLALIVAMPMAVGAVGQGSKAPGKTAELAEAWTQWAYSKPAAQSPLQGSYEGGPRCDGTPVSPTQGNTWFLAGTPDGKPVERTCTVPVGTRFFFPLVNATFFITEPDETEEEALDFVTDFIDEVEADPQAIIEVTVDGKEINSNRIVRAQTPFFGLTFQEGNIFGVPPGEYQTISDGLWVTLPPLPPGEHTIHFEISAQTETYGRVTQDNTYYLTGTTPSGTAPATTPATAATTPAATTPPTTANTPAATAPPAAPQPLP